METIAEIGKNFVSTKREEPLGMLLNKAKELIYKAKESGCDTAKFQVHNYEDEIHPEAKLISPHFTEDRYKWVKRNTYPEEFWWELKKFCLQIEIRFLATPMSRGAAELLHEIGVDRWKIGSGDILDFVMLDYIRETGHPVILSSGMSSLEELRLAYDYLREKIEPWDISILHCISSYPCRMEDLNLATIPFLKKQFPEAKIGFSDHSLGIEGALMAVSLGTEIIEKHLTLDRNAFGPDHKVSLVPEEMTRLVYRIRNDSLMKPTNKVLGVETKHLHKSEEAFRPIFHKGLYAAYDLEKDKMFEPDMFYAMRPRIPLALPSREYPNLLGRFTNGSYKQYEPI